jgi:hypothetical protein
MHNTLDSPINMPKSLYCAKALTICTIMLYKQAFTTVHIDGFVDVLQRAPEKLRGMVRVGSDNLHQHAIQASFHDDAF